LRKLAELEPAKRRQEFIHVAHFVEWAPQCPQLQRPQKSGQSEEVLKMATYLSNGDCSSIYIGGHAWWRKATLIVRVVAHVCVVVRVGEVVRNESLVRHPPAIRVDSVIFILAPHHRIEFCVADYSGSVVIDENIALE